VFDRVTGLAITFGRWQDADLNLYAKQVCELLAQVDIPTDALLVTTPVQLIILLSWKNTIMT